MKLFTRYARLNVWAMVAVFLIGAGALFFTFRYILIKQIDEALDTERDENLQYIHQYGKLPTPVSIADQRISYIAVSKPAGTAYTTVKLPDEEGTEDFRQLSFPVAFEGRNYQFYISLPLEQTEALLKIVAFVTIITIALMMMLVYLINRYVVRHLLKPFYSTIDTARRYSFTQRQPLRLPPTAIEEFTMLNETLNGLAARGLQDYQLMREFTSNAAHEMQTPLAVMRTKLEGLMQSPDINEAQAKEIMDVDDSVERLTRLFKSLLLLTKIENGQFPIGEEVALHELVAGKAAELSEMIEGRGIAISLDRKPASIRCNPYLADILVGNLLNNAIRYNYTGGAIDVCLQQGELSVSNTSSLPQLEAAKLFQPFYRHTDSGQDGNGLGLSIVKQICVASGIDVSYTFENGMHHFNVLF